MHDNFIFLFLNEESVIAITVEFMNNRGFVHVNVSKSFFILDKDGLVVCLFVFLVVHPLLSFNAIILKGLQSPEGLGILSSSSSFKKSKIMKSFKFYKPKITWPYLTWQTDYIHLPFKWLEEMINSLSNFTIHRPWPQATATISFSAVLVM